MSDYTERAPGADYGKHLPEFETEYQLQEWLESQFEDFGWTAIREVSPRHSRVKCDLLVRPPDDPFWIGVETKLLRSTAQAGRIGRAIQQVLNRYQGKEFLGNRVELWSIAPYFTRQNVEGANRTTERVLQMFANSFGVGYLGLGGARLRIKWQYSDHSKMIWVGQRETEHYNRRTEAKYSGKTEYCDFERIRYQVRDRPMTYGGDQ
jgi:hypothetical protein